MFFFKKNNRFALSSFNFDVFFKKKSIFFVKMEQNI